MTPQIRLTSGGGSHAKPRTLAIYLVPVKRKHSNLLRYFETRSEADGSFELRNLPPGEYLALPTNVEENRPPGIFVRQDANLRTKVTRDVQKLNQSIRLKPCERIEDFELPNQPVTRQ